MSGSLRFLFFADTHLGFDHPVRPRVRRRRRGADFFANFERVLRTAVEERVDFLVHGGDVFHRQRVPAPVVQRAFLALKRVADAGIPVFVVPGNHERSRIPFPALAEHPGVHLFHRPATFTLERVGRRVALTGFPYHREGVRSACPDLLRRTGWQAVPADLHLLCTHHCFEGATVGPRDFVFRHQPDVIRPADIPRPFAAVLSGHIHRHQILTHDLDGRPLATPVVYSGSIERTAFAEIGEPKGFLVGAVDAGSLRIRWQFRPLPARPMVRKVVERPRWDRDALRRAVTEVVAACDPDAVFGIRVRGAVTPDAMRAVSAGRLREMIPPTLNVDIGFDAGRTPGGRSRRGRRPPPDAGAAGDPAPRPPEQLSLV